MTRFYTRVLEGYLAERARFEAARGPERYQQGLERLEMSQRLAATGVLGEFGCIAVNPQADRGDGLRGARRYPFVQSKL